jgi:hypothetical protein
METDYLTKQSISSRRIHEKDHFQEELVEQNPPKKK